MLRTRSEVSLEIGGGGFAPDPLFPGRFSLACVTSIFNLIDYKNLLLIVDLLRLKG